ncbi:pyridoxal-phosphate dependent enzyme [Actinoplanes sp. NPDC051633]|uniref:1-aminocyclopropane-1-carboxylate deaminase/D-cysteine desulfhydrase n=1 Tax=Actinoplanes sp. NPDC051633 TaxID=3155670 RepID=UPI0034156EE0
MTSPISDVVLGLPSPLEELADDRARAAGVRLLLKRDDLIHPDLPGNKWRKLKHNLAAAASGGSDTLLTFGGAYSKQILATAAAGHHFGFATIGVVRGEEHLPLNPILGRAAELGMTITYVDRAQYRNRAEPAFLRRLHREFGRFFVIPAGGANPDGVRGCAELPSEITEPYDVVCCSSGTGTTLAGIAAGLPPGREAIGFGALKGDFLAGDVAALQRAYGRTTTNWSIEPEFHFGGFARRTAALDAFVVDFESRHGITLDAVYEAKMMAGIMTLLDRGRWPAGTTLVAVLG